MEMDRFFEPMFLLRLTICQFGRFNYISVYLAVGRSKRTQRSAQVTTLNLHESFQLKISCFIHTLAAVLQLLQCSSLLTGKHRPPFDIVLGWFTLSVHTITTLYLHICRGNGITWTFYLNNLLEINPKFETNKISNFSNNLKNRTFTYYLSLAIVPCYSLPR